MITLKNIRVTFSQGTVLEKKAIRGISLDFDEGEFITVIGSNGAGKSTLLNAIAGEVRLSHGSMSIDKKDMTRLKAYERANLVARVFQDPLAGTCGDLTIAENLSIAKNRVKRLGFSSLFRLATSHKDRQDYKELLSRLKLGLENRLDTPMSLLSGGQRQAVSLLMATLSPLKILLLDEHTAALDPKTAEFIMGLTAKIVAEKKLTVLMVTHSLHQALEMGTRTVMLHEGKIIYDVKDAERSKLTPSDLLRQFGTKVDDDRLLLQ